MAAKWIKTQDPNKEFGIFKTVELVNDGKRRYNTELKRWEKSIDDDIDDVDYSSEGIARSLLK